MRNRRARVARPCELIGAIVIAALAISACGGGGGGSSSGPPAVSNRSISGVITPSLDSAVDGDTNDTSALTPFIQNNSFEAAQVIGNPSTVGGYAAQINTGPLGRLNSAIDAQDIDDSSDVFRLRLSANQAVRLAIGDAQTGDLDLYLGLPDGTLVDASEGISNQEAVVAPADAEYIVEVFAFEGYSNYVLQTDSSAATASVETYRYGSDFVPGEVIVGVPPPGAKAVTTGAAAAATARQMGWVAKAGAPGIEQLLKVPEAASNIAFRLAAQTRNPILRPEVEDDKLRTLSAAKALARSAPDMPVSLNYLYKSAAEPTDPLANYQWHYNLINLPAALDITDGDGALVAVVDTGVVLNHPDLVTQLDPSDPDGVDFISDPNTAADGDGIDGNAFDVGDRPFVGAPSSFHGTHVAGTIAAATNNGQGVAGVAGGARMMPLRVLGRAGRGSSFDILQAVRYASRQNNAWGTLPPQRADVINLSLGGTQFSSSEQSVYTAARAAGSILVAAAGNDSSAAYFYPASYDGVISVAAVGRSGTKSPYSQFNDAVDVSAPGGDSRFRIEDGVLSTVADDSTGTIRLGYGFLDGTSMATPHVAGVIALMRAVHPGITPSQIDALLAAGSITQDLGAPGYDTQYGHGLIDARRAVQEAQRLSGAPVEPDPPQAVSSPPSLEISARQASRTFTVSNAGGGSLTISGVSDDASWLTVTNIGPNSYQASVNRTGLSSGIHKAQITVLSNASPLVIPVSAEVRSADSAANAGTLYVLAINSDTGEVVAQAEVRAINGEYAYTIADVPPGAYLIVAGSDPDNDLFICSPGEACGAYPTLDSSGLVNVNDATNVDGINFQSVYNASVGAASAPRSAATPAGPGPYRRSGGRRLR